MKKVTENKNKVTENKMITKLIKRGFYNNESSLGSFYKTNYYRPETIKTGETTETQILSGIKTKYFSTVLTIRYCQTYYQCIGGRRLDFTHWF